MSKYHLPSKHQFQDVIRLVTGCHRIFDSRWKKHIKAVCYQRLILYAVRLGGEQAVFSLQEMHNQIPKNIGLGLSDSPLLQSSHASRHLQRPSQTPEKHGLQSDSQQGRRPTKGLGSVLLPLQTALEICWHFLQHSSHLSHLLSIAHCETILDFNYPENSFQLLWNITESP